jgi:CheY-like chemotaxis protein
MEPKPTILVVEHDVDYVLLLRLAMERAGIKHPVQVVASGREAIDYLQANPPYMDRAKYPFPKVLFTDLKMPNWGGFEVLEWLKNHPDCSVIPVIVLTASKLDEDVKQAYKLGANAYLVKPSSIDSLEKMLKTSFEFWEMCEMPSIPPKC